MSFNSFTKALSVAFLFLLAALVAANAQDQIKIAAFGDSLMAGYNLGAGEGFADQLQNELQMKGHSVTVINAAVSGDTTSGGLARLDWSIPVNVDLVILGLGANDMLRGIAPEETEKNLQAIIDKFKSRKQHLLLIGMVAAPNLGENFSARFNPIYPQLAKKNDLPLYPFFLDGVIPNAELLLEDRMHPNQRGVAVMVRGILPMVEAELKKIDPN
ncbi:arylesterase [Limoniibacter endophyticus]|uniref:Arylesterase n=1 Tax=Limoniibacter endophyticus TaxID=1565040 RepID=A0A8J3DT53_9HYPH|nr:arylesterase [Limoniibacter endophyticus]GHC74096.1 arylesterase [Limoniibacter endophyticus]